ncbi:MAG: enoyl-CoA hydratase [Deltaproteobacteria bacterium]|jgi:enoyl-CoA hydratase/carnithine racemase|nr:enoyl-CoA hydratase [Deltaproteobacteria bacterium]
MSEESRMITELDEHGVLLITMNRPRKKNAFDDRQWDALAEALSEADADPRVAVVVLTGAGGNFSSGADLSGMGEARTEPRSDGHASGFFACEAKLLAFEKPLLTAVSGVAVGGGCTIALASDITYVGHSLRARLPFANLGLVPEIGSSYTLQASIGRQRANELMFTAEWIDAERAIELGMAARALPDDELLGATLAKAREIAQWPTSALVAIKRTMNEVHKVAIAAALEIEHVEMSKQAGSPENIEAIRAFIEKRPPDFRQFRK